MRSLAGPTRSVGFRFVDSLSPAMMKWKRRRVLAASQGPDEGEGGGVDPEGTSRANAQLPVGTWRCVHGRTGPTIRCIRRDCRNGSCRPGRTWIDRPRLRSGNGRTRLAGRSGNRHVADRPIGKGPARQGARDPGTSFARRSSTDDGLCAGFGQMAIGRLPRIRATDHGRWLPQAYDRILPGALIGSA